jgi:hypothetical protein
MKNASPALISELWRKVADTAVNKMKSEPDADIYISTSGMGVSWLHVRIDSRPKYYNYEPYKHTNKEKCTTSTCTTF